MRKKIFAITCATIAAVILLMGYVAYAGSRQIELRQVDRQLGSLCGIIQDALLREGPDDLSAFAARYTAGGEFRVTLLAADGGVLADTESDAAAMDNHISRPEITQALLEGSGSAQRFSATRFCDMRYFAKVLDDGMILRLSVPVDALWQFQGDVLLYILYAVLLSILLSVFVIWAMTRYTVRPVELWARWAQAVARSPEALPPEPPPDKHISPAIQEVGSRLHGAVSTLGHANREMDGILSGMASGLIAVNPDHSIAWMNRQAMRIFRIAQGPAGLDVVAATQQARLADALSSGNAVEITQGGKTYVAHTTRSGERILLWLNDTTGEKGPEIQRREFAASVSHELKTPLAVIQGAVDSLRGADNSAEELDLIEREVLWLNDLTRDLLELTGVESMLEEAEAESVFVQDVVADVRRALRSACEAKSVQIYEDIPPLSVKANYTRLRQLVSNLAANAVRYNREGGCVDIRARGEGSMLILSVADTGIGIPEAERERIFERFYRVDRARGRADGGTGLGLSIVKHIVRLYKGSIEVTQNQGQGSVFTVHLPIIEEEEHAKDTF